MTNSIRSALGCALLTAVLLSIPPIARAQSAAPGTSTNTSELPQEPTPGKADPFAARRGFVVGVGLHVGSLILDGDRVGTGGSFDLTLGWNVARRFAVLSEFVVASVGTGANTTLNEWQALLALQYWPIEYGWIRAGLGVSALSTTLSGNPEPDFIERFDNWLEGRDTVENGTYALDSGLTVQLAGGYDVWRSTATSLEMQVRLHYSKYSDVDANAAMVSMGAEFAWY